MPRVSNKTKFFKKKTFGDFFYVTCFIELFYVKRDFMQRESFFDIFFLFLINGVKKFRKNINVLHR